MASGRTRRVCRRPQSSSFVHELRVDSFVVALLPVAVSFSVNSCIVKSFGAVASPGLWSTPAESVPSFASVLHFQSRLRVELVCDALHRGMCKQFGLLSRTPKRATRRSPPRAPAPQIQISNLGSAGAARVIPRRTATATQRARAAAARTGDGERTVLLEPAMPPRGWSAGEAHGLRLRWRLTQARQHEARRCGEHACDRDHRAVADGVGERAESER